MVAQSLYDSQLDGTSWPSLVIHRTANGASHQTGWTSPDCTDHCEKSGVPRNTPQDRPTTPKQKRLPPTVPQSCRALLVGSSDPRQQKEGLYDLRLSAGRRITISVCHVSYTYALMGSTNFRTVSFEYGENGVGSFGKPILL